MNHAKSQNTTCHHQPYHAEKKCRDFGQKSPGLACQHQQKVLNFECFVRRSFSEDGLTLISLIIYPFYTHLKPDKAIIDKIRGFG